jgi:trehalose-phosphatase
MNEGLAEACSAVVRELEQGKRIALFVDYDGTLAPIEKDPRTPAALPESLAALERLVRSDSVWVAIVSGRAADDVRVRIPLDIVFVGNHGLEIRGCGISRVDPVAKRLRSALRSLANELAIETSHLPGVMLEDKIYSLSVHYRNAGASARNALTRIMADAVPQFSTWRVRRGDCVFEILPAGAGGKGRAVRRIISLCGLEDAVPLCIGDDETDESMFRGVPGAITIHSGNIAKTAARYCLAGPEEVARLLTHIAIAAHDPVRANRMHICNGA